MQPAWHLLWLISISSSCFASTMHLHMQANNPQLSIKLSSNPTTGFTWKLISYDKNVLQFNSQKYISSTPQAIGSGGTTEFYFTGLKHPSSMHTTKLILNYSRSWEKNAGKITEVIVDLN